MVHIPPDDIQQLYQENSEQSWSGLQRILRQHKGKAEGIEDSIVDLLLIADRRLEESGEPYPGSADQLQRVLEGELSAVTK